MEEQEEVSALGRRAMLGLAISTPLLFSAASVEASDRMPADLSRAVDAHYRAALANDTRLLSELLTDDYMLVNSDSSVQDKQSYLADFLVPGFRMDPYVMQQPVCRAWGEAALTGGVQPLGWTQDGEHHSRMLRIAHVWVRRGGRWLLAYTQLTRIPD